MRKLLEKGFQCRHVIYALLIVCAYGISLHVPFYFDDVHSIQDNAALNDLSNWYRYWIDTSLSSSLPANRSYRPMSFMVYNLLKWMGNGSTLPFHIHKLLLLFGICVLIEKIWNRLNGSSRYFGFSLACLWAVHPALSESTIYITASSSLQAAFFYFLAFWLYLCRPLRLWPILLAYAASCFSKEEGITLPAMIFFWSSLQGDWKKNWRTIGTLAMFGAGLFVFIQTRIPADQSVSRGDVPPFQYLFTQIRAWLHYEWLWIWPSGLNADNTQFGFSKSFFETDVLACFAFQLTVTAGLFWKRRKFPLLWFGWVWYYVTISPASSFIPLAEPVNERRMIIAYLGYTGALQWAVWQLAAARSATLQRSVVATYGSLLMILLVITIARGQTWNHPVELWTDVVHKNPDSVRALNNLASVKINEGDYEGALHNVQSCLAKQTYLYCKINEGIILAQLHRYAEAKSAFEYATEHSEGVAAPHYYFAKYWFQVAEYEKAIQEADRSLQISGGMHSPSQALKDLALKRLREPH